MKDSADKFTADLIGSTGRRGRKPKKDAKTPAQRMREYRQRMELYQFDLRAIRDRKREKCYSTYAEAFDDLLSDLIHCQRDWLPPEFFEEFPELFEDGDH